MKIGLIDVDSHNFPNIPLMKISAYHKAQGDTVEWHMPLDTYDIVYMSKVFTITYTDDYPLLIKSEQVIKGGTGYDIKNKLPTEIESMCPDYNFFISAVQRSIRIPDTRVSAQLPVLYCVEKRRTKKAFKSRT